MRHRAIFFVGPLLILALGAAGPLPGPGQPIILQGPIGPDLVPGLPYGQFPPGLEPRLPILPPPPPPPLAGVPFGASPTQTLPGCQAYAQSYQRLDCETNLNRVEPRPVTTLENNPPIPPNFPSNASVPAVVPIAPVTPLETHLAPGTITDPRSGKAIPPNRPLP